MANRVVVSLDIGTSSVRAMLFDTRGGAVPGGIAQHTHQPISREPGESTLDAAALVESALDCLRAVIDRPDLEICGVATSTFWHSMTGVDQAGSACTPVYLWSDTRSSRVVEELRSGLDETAIHGRTGCLFHTSYLPARLLWLQQTHPDLFARACRWVSPGEYLYFRLFGEWRCSLSMASGTGLLNQDTMDWDAELLSRLGLRKSSLSTLADVDQPMTGLKGEHDASLGALSQVPWYLALGDGACSNIGSGGIDHRHLTVMVGTSGAMRLLGEGQGAPPRGLWKYRLDRRRSLTGGALSNGGAVYQWLIETLKLPPGPQIEQALACAVPDSHGLTVLPFFLGERSPEWYSHATGALLGLTMSTTPQQIVQASLEAVAYRFSMVHELLAPLAAPDHVLMGSGAGLSHSPAWTQMLADTIGRPLLLMKDAEGSARGAALVALEQLKLSTGREASLDSECVRFEPDPARHTIYQRARQRHAEAAERLLCYNDDRKPYG